MSDDDHHERVLGTIGDTEVRIVADGPKAQWCADVLHKHCMDVFEDIRAQVEGWTDE